MKKCKFCAEEVQDEAVVCKHCGSSLGVQSLSENIIGSSVSSVNNANQVGDKKNCRDCGALNENSSKFCVQCGSDKVGKKCAKCGAAANGEEKFCAKCGFDLSVETEHVHAIKSNAAKKISRSFGWMIFSLVAFFVTSAIASSSPDGGWVVGPSLILVIMFFVNLFRWIKFKFSPKIAADEALKVKSLKQVKNNNVALIMTIIFCLFVSGGIFLAQETEKNDLYSADVSCKSKYGNASFFNGNNCSCSNGFIFSKNGDLCITLSESCQETWPNTVDAGIEDGKRVCDCAKGFYWNKAGTKCLSKT